MIQIDANLFEDVIRKRQGWKASSAVIDLVKKGDIAGGLSAWTVAVIYYFRRRSGMNDRSARQRAAAILKGFTVLDLTAKIVALALDDWRFSGFEDALQFHTARENGVDIFVTRNVRHFQVVKDELTILTPEDFLAQM